MVFSFSPRKAPEMITSQQTTSLFDTTREVESDEHAEAEKQWPMADERSLSMATQRRKNTKDE
jgi:hypothetical protein